MERGAVCHLREILLHLVKRTFPTQIRESQGQPAVSKAGCGHLK